ncbi:MAG: cytochrome c3 family protein, partial [Candidatus Zixiibacteriota bacterium]
MRIRRSFILIIIFSYLALLGILVLSPQVSSKTKECYDCHKQAKKDFDKKFVHRPVKKKNCKGCHESHGCAQRLVLKETGSALCFDCHKDLEEKYLKGIAHHPVKEGKCFFCHDPHASEEKFLIRETEAVSPCFVCHDELEQKTKEQFLHDPFAKNECAVCHAVHNS